MDVADKRQAWYLPRVSSESSPRDGHLSLPLTLFLSNPDDLDGMPLSLCARLHPGDSTVHLAVEWRREDHFWAGCWRGVWITLTEF
jgi:hypothetical protein